MYRIELGALHAAIQVQPPPQISAITSGAGAGIDLMLLGRGSALPFLCSFSSVSYLLRLEGTRGATNTRLRPATSTSQLQKSPALPRLPYTKPQLVASK